MAGRRLLYIEFDGQVFLVKRGGKWTFPTVGEAVPFPVAERHRARILDAEVLYCRPTLDAFPADWTYKDDVPHMEDVDAVVQQAINASLARCVVGVLVRDAEGRVLMVKSSRGFTKGMWNIPGGFVDYGEHPEEAAVRELAEETGLEVELGGLLGVYKERFASPYFMYGFMYEGRTRAGTLRVDPTEIEEAAWMDPRTAYAQTRNPFARNAFVRVLGEDVASSPKRRGQAQPT